VLTIGRIFKEVLKELRTQLLSPSPNLVQLHRSQLVYDDVLIVNVWAITADEVDKCFNDT